VEPRVVKPALVLFVATACQYSATFADCEVTCHGPGSCPDGFTCGNESLCRSAGATQTCNQVLGDAHLADGGGNTSVTLRQTTDDSVAPNITLTCTNPDGTTADEHWYRVFSLSQAGITTTLHVDKVTFGVEQASGGPSVRVALATYTGTFGAATLDPTKIAPLVANPIVVPDTTTGELVVQQMNQNVPGGANLVVELDVADQNGTNKQVKIGLTTSAEGRPGYEDSAKCGPSAPTSPSNKHFIITVTGTH
jgi:hypothetical protein